MIPVDDLRVGEVILRLTSATVVGCVIGLNRELKGKPAGLRTHALVTLGAALVTLSSIHLSMSEGVIGSDALSRVIQGIITGIGFLGAGVIIRDEIGHVRGLTTAATIWVAASLGIVCGVGYWVAVVVAVCLVMLVLVFGGPVEKLAGRAMGKLRGEPHDL